MHQAANAQSAFHEYDAHRLPVVRLSHPTSAQTQPTNHASQLAVGLGRFYFREFSFRLPALPGVVRFVCQAIIDRAQFKRSAQKNTETARIRFHHSISIFCPVMINNFHLPLIIDILPEVFLPLRRAIPPTRPLIGHSEAQKTGSGKIVAAFLFVPYFYSFSPI